MRTISIVCVVDVAGVLARNKMSGNHYLVDNNKVNGSTEEGTEVLKTKVSKGDKVVWVAQPLETESFASIEGILIDKDYCNPKKKYYEGTNVSYWVGIVKKDTDQHEIPYNLQFKVGSRAEEMLSSAIPTLVIIKEENPRGENQA
ncbi:MAG: hypothetical protein HRU20_15825 [Pseudomonadales bacterium]|nr:hypothetical protein [Pseudomonadales bacterium]